MKRTFASADETHIRVWGPVFPASLEQSLAVPGRGLGKVRFPFEPPAGQLGAPLFRYCKA